MHTLLLPCQPRDPQPFPQYFSPFRRKKRSYVVRFVSLGTYMVARIAISLFLFFSSFFSFRKATSTGPKRRAGGWRRWATAGCTCRPSHARAARGSGPCSRRLPHSPRSPCGRVRFARKLSRSCTLCFYGGLNSLSTPRSFSLWRAGCAFLRRLFFAMMVLRGWKVVGVLCAVYSLRRQVRFSALSRGSFCHHGVYWVLA